MIPIELYADLFSFTTDAGTGRVLDETRRRLGPGYLCIVSADPSGASSQMAAGGQAYAELRMPGLGRVTAAGFCALLPAFAELGVTGFQVRVHEVARGGRDGRADDFAHEGFMPGRQVMRRMRGQQPQHELGGLFGGELAAVVAVHQVVIQAAGLDGVARAARARQVIGPLVVAVERQQGVIQVEQGETSGGHVRCESGSASMARSRGRVMGRPVARE